jgi:hypothetical protein
MLAQLARVTNPQNAKKAICNTFSRRATGCNVSGAWGEADVQTLA